MTYKSLLNIFFLLFIAILPLKSQIIYVKPNGTGNGSSWSQARGDLRVALASAGYGTQIWVAQGTYYATQCTTCGENDRKLSFVVKDGVALYGGFSGSETSLTQRDWVKYPTVLSGDIDKNSDLTNNTYNIIYTNNASAQTIIDGFTISGANADYSASISEPFTSGGAIFNDGRTAGGFSSPSVRNCIFRDNYAVGFGGAVFNHAGYGGFCAGSFKNCQFINNTSKGGGGAICNFGVFEGTCIPTFEFCNFIENHTNNSGGAVLQDGQKGKCEASFINCKFIKNVADLYGGGVYNLGKTGNCTPTITNCLFWANKAFSAAGVYCLGSESGNSNPRITNCVFYKNQAQTGGSVYANAGEDPTTGKATGIAKPVITNCIIWKNIAGTAPQLRDINGLPTISYSIVDAANCAAIHSGVGDGVTCGSGMLYNQDPLFVDPDNGDFHFQANSPAINAGLNAVISSQSVNYDLDSLPRYAQTLVDIGVYEYNPSILYPPQVQLSPESQTVCAGTRVSLKVTASGAQPLFYKWFKNNIEIPTATADSLVFTATKTDDLGSYKCVVTNEVGKKAESLAATLTVNPLLTLTANNALTKTVQCVGETAEFTATYQNGGADPKIEWLQNGVKVAENIAVLKTIIKNAADKYAFRVTSSEQCVTNNMLISNELQVPVEVWDTMKLSLAASTNKICAGENVLFTTSLKTLDNSPQYRWYVNDNLMPITTATYQTTTLNDGDKVYCTAVSSRKCVVQNTVSSNVLSTAVSPKVTVGVLISADKSTICAGQTVTFTSIPTGGGVAPQYSWSVNDTTLVNEHNPFLKINTLKNGDFVKAAMVSTEVCPERKTAISNSLRINAAERTIPEVSISALKMTVCRKESVTFEAVGANSEDLPQYQWLLNGKPISGQTQKTYRTDSLKYRDSIGLIVTLGSECFKNTTPIYAKVVKPTVKSCFPPKTNIGSNQLVLVPNPSVEPRLLLGMSPEVTGLLNVSIFNEAGFLILNKKIEKTENDLEISLDDIQPGMYIVRVQGADINAYRKWIYMK